MIITDMNFILIFISLIQLLNFGAILIYPNFFLKLSGIAPIDQNLVLVNRWYAIGKIQYSLMMLSLGIYLIKIDHISAQCALGFLFLASTVEIIALILSLELIDTIWVGGIVSIGLTLIYFLMYFLTFLKEPQSTSYLNRDSLLVQTDNLSSSSDDGQTDFRRY